MTNDIEMRREIAAALRSTDMTSVQMRMLEGAAPKVPALASKTYVIRGANRSRAAHAPPLSAVFLSAIAWFTSPARES